MAAAPSEHIQVDRIGSEEPTQCCIASSKQLNFALSLSSFAKSIARMPCLLENKSAMHSALRHLFLLLPLSIGVSLRVNTILVQEMETIVLQWEQRSEFSDSQLSERAH
jgi:hypothetical protein